MLKRIEEFVAGLTSQGSTIFILKDELADLCKSFQRLSTTTDQSRLRAQHVSREINDRYRAWYATAWPLVNANLPERLKELEELYQGATSAISRDTGPAER